MTSRNYVGWLLTPHYVRPPSTTATSTTKWLSRQTTPRCRRTQSSNSTTDVNKFYCSYNRSAYLTFTIIQIMLIIYYVILSLLFTLTLLSDLTQLNPLWPNHDMTYKIFHNETRISGIGKSRDAALHSSVLAVVRLSVCLCACLSVCHCHTPVLCLNC